MSHFTVAVITKDGDYKKALAPFDENLEVEPYINKTEKQIVEHVKELKESHDRCVAEGKDDSWFDEHYGNVNWDDDKSIHEAYLKLWKDDEKRNSRPKSVVVEIFRDGTSYKQVVLSSENNWSYSWLTKRDGANWVVIERNTPSSYAMTVERRENSFVVTNTFVSPNPNGPIDEPKTGDTSNLMFYVVLMIISGSVSIILGIIGKRSNHEESK